jgi:hypothetical protein
MAPEPIPIFLFAEARAKFDEPFASALADDGLDEVIAALRSFAPIKREMVGARVDAQRRNPSSAPARARNCLCKT